MGSLTEITLWFKGKFRKFNHIEEGHSRKGTPIYNCQHQRDSWVNAIWRKRWAYLQVYNKNEIPIVVPQYESDRDE